MPQKVIPIRFRNGRPDRNREFFPLSFKLAVQQRTR